MVKNMKEITSLDILSFAKIQALIMLVIGFISSLLNIIVALFKTHLGFWAIISAIILTPLILAILGFVGGALGAWLYNKFAEKIGGMKIMLK